MAKIYERLLSTTKLQENRRDSFDPQRENLLIDLLRLFQTRTFVLSSKHQNQNVATIGTLLDQFMLSCK